MIILIDIGNTAIKWVVLEQQPNHLKSAKVRFVNHDESNYDVFWQNIISTYNISQASTPIVGISSVRPSVSEPFIRVAPSWLIDDAFIASTDKDFEVLENSYQTPENMGVDRWMAMIGGFYPDKKGCLIIDLGTAITVDLVNNHGKHMGGYIVAGLQKQLSTLLSHTERVWAGNELSKSILPGKNTPDCVNNGVIAQAVGFIVFQARKAFENGICKLILTGGDGQLIYSIIKDELKLNDFVVEYRPKLIFEGLLTSLLKYRKKM